MREKVGLTGKGAVGADFKADGAGVAEVFCVGADCAAVGDCAAVDAGLHAGTGVTVRNSGKPVSINPNREISHGAPYGSPVLRNSAEFSHT